jgi:UDP-N-acetylmuramate-alanine ligase
MVKIKAIRCFINMEIRKCKFCGLQLFQRDDEHLSAFLRRVYCDTKCAISGQRAAKHWRHEGWLSEGKERKGL